MNWEMLFTAILLLINIVVYVLLQYSFHDAGVLLSCKLLFFCEEIELSLYFMMSFNMNKLGNTAAFYNHFLPSEVKEDLAMYVQRAAHYWEGAQDCYDRGFDSQGDWFMYLYKDELRAKNEFFRIHHSIARLLCKLIKKNEYNTILYHSSTIRLFRYRKHQAQLWLEKVLSHVRGALAHQEHQASLRRDRLAYLAKVRQSPFCYFTESEKICDSFSMCYSIDETESSIPTAPKKTRFIFSSQFRSCGTNSIPYIKEKNIYFLRRLQDKIFLLSLRRQRASVPQYIIRDDFEAYLVSCLPKGKINNICDLRNLRYESDTSKDGQGESMPSMSTGKNVILTETNEGPSTSEVSHDVGNIWRAMSSTDVKDSYANLTGRYYEVKSFKWTKDDASGSSLIVLDLPKDMLTVDHNRPCDMPNTIPFNVNSMASYDLEIKVQLNAQKFQIGQLMVAWFYFPDFDNSFKNRLNLATMSQTRHELITANVSNEVTLRIPYNYYSAYIRTRGRKDFKKTNTMGRLYITVLNPLTVSTVAPSYCHGTVFVRFLKAEFTGTISGRFGVILPKEEIEVEPNSVFSNVMQGAVRGLMTSLTDNNRDNPPDPRAPMYIVPSASHSWSVGNGLREPLHTLRLDGRGQHPYVDGSTDEMSVRSIASTYGLVRTITVIPGNLTGARLAVFEASPMMSKDQYLSRQVNTMHAATYALPPVAVVSNLFNYWRGSLKFRFDFIYSTIGHNARFLIAYVPGAVSTDNVTLDIAKSSPHIVVSLGECQSITYEIPFISPRPFWGRNYTGNYDVEFVDPPSMVYVFVLNPLIPMEAVAQQMYINVWVAAGNDFEVAVPIQPNIGLSFNSMVIYNNTNLIGAMPGYFPYYFGTYFRALNSSILVARHAATSGASAVFEDKMEKISTVNRCFCYEVYATTGIAKYMDDKGKIRYAQWGVMCETSEPGDWIMVLCSSLASAKRLAQLVHFQKISISSTTPDQVNKILGYCIQVTSINPTTNNTYCDGNMLWRPIDVPSTLIFDSPDKTVISSVNNSIISQCSRIMFGESFMDLKDLCRRYQLYGQLDVNLSGSSQNQCVVNVPVLMQGLSLDVGTPARINEFSNRCREGHIPIIASAFRVGSGSVRYRLVVPSNLNIGIWVQHRPDRSLRTKYISQCKEVVTAEGLQNHSYASYIQLTSINGIIEFEVPFYVPGPFVMLQDPIISQNEDKYFYSLGELSIGFVFKSDSAKTDFTCNLYYALGDDARFSLFQGFPPMMLLDDISEVIAEPQGIFDKVLSNATASVSSTIKTDVMETVAPVVDKASAMLDGLNDYLKDSPFKKMVADQPVIRQVLYSIINFVVNPNIKTAVWGIVTILIEIGLLATSLISSFVSALTEVFNYIKTKFGVVPNASAATQPDPAAEVIVQPNSPSTNPFDEDDASMMGLITVMWASLCTFLSYKGAQPSNMKQYCKFLTQDMSAVFRSANGLFTFLRNIMAAFKKMYKWILNKVYPAYGLLTDLADKYDEIKAWMNEVNYLCDPLNRESIFANSVLIERVYAAYDEGALLLLPTSDLFDDEDKEAMRVLSIVRDRFRDITKLKLDCVNMGLDSHIRKLCFSICIYGMPGMGKSHFGKYLAGSLLKAVNYKTNGPLLCYVKPTDKYWSQCARQPVLVFDDLWAVEQGEPLFAQIGALNAVVSPVPLTPPMADLPDKKMRYNPEIFMYYTNKPFVVLDKVDKEMIWRRRDVLIKVRHITVEEKKTDCIHCQEGWEPSNVPAAHIHLLDDYHHLRFGIHNNVKVQQEDFDWLDYPKLLIIMKDRFVDNRTKEAYNFKKELDFQADFRTDLDELAPDVTIHEKLQRIRERKIDRNLRISELTLSTYFSDLSTDMFKSTLEQLRRMVEWGDCIPLEWQGPTDFFNRFRANFKSFYKNMFSKSDAVPEADDPVPSTSAEVPAAETLVLNDFCDTFLPGNKAVSIRQLMALDRKYYSDSSIIEEAKKYRCTSIVLHELLVLYESEMITKQMFNSAVCSIKGERRKTSLTTLFRLISPDVRAHIRQRRYTSWLDYYIEIIHNNVRRRGEGVVLQQHVQACLHYRLKIREMSWTKNGGWRDSVGAAISMEPCGIWCILHCKLIFKELLMAWMEFQPTVATLMRKGRFEEIPPELSDQSILFPDKQHWEDLFKEWAQTALKWTCDKMKWAYNYFLRYWPEILTTLGSLTAIFGTLYVMHEAVRLESDELQLRYARQGAVPRPQSAYHIDPRPASINTGMRVATFESSTQQYSHVIELIKRNTVFITCVFDGKEVEYRCLSIRFKEVLILRHYADEIDLMPPHTIFYYRTLLTPVKESKFGVLFDFGSCKIKWYNHKQNEYGAYPSNFGLVFMPHSFPDAKTIVPFIATAKTHDCVNGMCDLIENAHIHSNMVTRREKGRIYTVKSEHMKTVSMNDVYTYPVQGRGKCGSVLVNANLQRPIIGMHVAGLSSSGTYGISEPLCAEMFESLKETQRPFERVVIPNLEPVDLDKIDLETAIFPYGNVTGTYIQGQSGKTTYEPSLVQGVVPVETEPNPLSRKDWRLPKGCDPMKRGVDHKGRCPIDFEDECLNECAEDLESLICSNVVPVRTEVGVLDIQTAVCGDPNIEGFEKLEFSTSAGFPLSSIKDGSRSGKWWLFDLEENDTQGYTLKSLHPELQRLMDLNAEMRRRSIRPFTVFVDCLKDTCLPLDKCRVPGKTRIFSISPVQFTIQFKQYCLDFLASYTKARFSVEHAIGIAAQSQEWSSMTQSLVNFSDKIVTGDYKNFGPGLMKKCAWTAVRVILNWYKYNGASDEHIQILSIMFDEIINAFYLCRNLVYQTPCGIPSGSPITAILNSMVNSLYVRYVYRKITNKSFTIFRNNVYFLTYGDDIIMSVKDDLIEEFNTLTMSEEFWKYNIVFTDQDKGKVDVKYRSIETATFLKRLFLPHPTRPGLWWGRLEERSINSCINWVHRKGNIIENTIQNCNQGLLLSVEFGEDYYRRLALKLTLALRNRGINFRYEPYRIVEGNFYSETK